MSRTKTLATLILSGATLGSCQSYVPEPKKKADTATIERYLAGRNNKNRYSPRHNRSDWERSQERKQEILQELRQIKDRIRIKTESFQVDGNTRITGYTAQQKMMVRCTKLMSRIAKEMA